MAGVSNTLGPFGIDVQRVMMPTTGAHRSMSSEQGRLNVAEFSDEVLALFAYEVQVARHRNVVGDRGGYPRLIFVIELAHREMDAPSVPHGVMEAPIDQERIGPIDEDGDACK